MKTIYYEWLNFIVLATLLIWFLRSKLNFFYLKQRNDLEAKLKASQEQNEKAKAAFQKIQTAYQGLEQKLADMKAGSLRQIDFETRRAEKDTELAIERVLHEGEARIKADIEKAKEELEQELFNSALLKAKELLTNQIKIENEAWISQMIQKESGAKTLESPKKNYAS